MNLKKLNNMSKKMSIISTGYKIYICYNETWKCGRYNNMDTEYYVSSLGRLYNINRKRFIIPFLNSSGYLYCNSYYNGKRTSLLVNKLVAETFLGYPSHIDKPEADHINSDKLDNSVKNLQWLTNLENLGKRKLSDQSEDQNSNVKYTKEFIIKIAELLYSGKYTMKEVSKILNVPYTTVSDIKSKSRWKKLVEKYDFSKVPSETRVLKRYTNSQIMSVGNLLKENKLSMKEISEITGVSYDMIGLIKNHKAYADLLKDYDFSEYNSGKKTFTKSQLLIIDKMLCDNYTPKEICLYLNIDYTKKHRNSIYDRKRKIKAHK